jgi:hypothetical protein
MRPDNVEAPAEVLQDQGRGGDETNEQAEATARRAKRKPKNVWVEQGRYLYRYGDNGSVVFDLWKLIGEPLPSRGRA